MKHTITKIWTVISLIVVFVLCFSGLAKLAREDAARARRDIKELEGKLTNFLAQHEVHTSQFDALQEEVNQLKVQLRGSIDSVQNQQPRATLKEEGQEPSSQSVARQPNPENLLQTKGSFQRQKKQSPHELVSNFDATKSLDENLAHFRKSLDENSLFELAQRVERKMQVNLQIGLDAAAVDNNLSQGERDLLFQAFQEIPQEDLDIIMKTQEESVLMEMMLERDRPIIEGAQTTVSENDLEQLKQKALAIIRNKEEQ